jgi:endoglucanase
MDLTRKTFLQNLLTTPGPSGFEQAAARVWRDEAASFADEVDRDVLGNSYAGLRHQHGPVVVIEGHIDEIGFLITYVDDDGFIWFDRIGGWDDQVVVGQRVVIATEAGHIRGVIGKKAAHLLAPEDRSKVTKLSDLWIDIGSGGKDQTLARLAIGDPIVLDVPPLELSDDLWVSRSIDNRAGAFVALEALRLLKDMTRACSVVAVAATHEETTMSGALNMAFHVRPAVGIAIDVTHATDYPGAEKKADNDIKVGGGPVLTRGSSINPHVFSGLMAAGASLGVNTPVQAAGRSSGTDADAMIRSGAGIATGLVSIPNRYMHSPNEVVSLRDLDEAARVIAGFVATITADSDFRP